MIDVYFVFCVSGSMTTNDVSQFSNRNHYRQMARIDCFADEHYIPSTTCTLAEGESAERFRELWRFAQERPKKKVWTSLTRFIVRVSIMSHMIWWGISLRAMPCLNRLNSEVHTTSIYFFMIASMLLPVLLAGALELSFSPSLQVSFPQGCESLPRRNQAVLSGLPAGLHMPKTWKL